VKIFQKVLSYSIITVFLFQNNIFAQNDINRHWAKQTIQSFIKDGIIEGYADSSIKPDNHITRAEFFSVINKLFGFDNKANIQFNDVDKNKWYSDAVSIAVGSGYVSGYSDNTIKPEKNITRQEAAVIIQKIINIDDYENGVYKFLDNGTIDKWSKGAVGAVSNAGIISGYNDLTFGAKKNITRAEAFTMIKKAYNYKMGISETTENTTEVLNTTENSTEKYIIPEIVDNTDEWKKAIDYATNNLYDTLTLKINDFDKTAYDLKNLGYYNISVKADGTVKNKVAEITYTFDYSTNFKMLCAKANKDLIPKLSNIEKETMNKVENIVSEITDNNMSDYEKEKAIHDYMVLNYEYDTDGIKSSDKNEAHEITGIVNSGKGVCEAYAYTFKLMADFAGLDVQIATGKIDNNVDHAWNIIKLDGEYYHIDVTSDDPVPDKKGRLLYNYFNLDDTEIKRSHSWQSNENVVCNGTKYNYFRYNNCIFSDITQLENYINKSIESNKTKIYFKTEGFVINGSEDIKHIFQNKGLSSFKITGDFGKESGYLLEIEYR